jgi:hypothetical protein
VQIVRRVLAPRRDLVPDGGGGWLKVVLLTSGEPTTVVSLDMDKGTTTNVYARPRPHS